MERLLFRVLTSIASIVPLFLAVFSLHNIAPVLSASPIAVSGAGYVTVDGTLYVQGGATFSGRSNASYSSALSSLSLSTPWNDTSPPWMSVNVGIQSLASNYLQSITATPDGTRLVFWGSFDPPYNKSFVIYNRLDNTWNTLNFVPSPLSVFSNGLKAVIDPTTPGGGLGNLYAPNGCYNITDKGGMCQVALDKKTLSSSAMSGSSIPLGIAYYSFVYCSLRSSMLLYGGLSSEPLQTNPSLYEYVASRLSWSLLVSVMLQILALLTVYMVSLGRSRLTSLFLLFCRKRKVLLLAISVAIAW